MLTEEFKLDNPIYYALLETHKEFCINYDGAKFYNPPYCSFGSFINTENMVESINQYSKLINNFYVVGEKPNFGSSISLIKNIVCNQMIIQNKIDYEITTEIIKLEEKHYEELFELINLVQPGFFKSKTVALGDYYGIFNNNKLVAVTGKRISMNSFTEVSAVVTHPNYTGRGFAKQLVSFVTNNIFEENKIPILHVAETNVGAINLYEKLGYTTRRKISFWNLSTK